MANLRNKKKILIIGEFPVIHKGYIDFFNNVLRKFQKANFYIGLLDKKIIKEMTTLELDIRSISSKEIKKGLRAYLPIKKFFLLKKDDFLKLIGKINPQKIIIIKGDKSENFSKNYLNNTRYKNITQYYDARLKWPSKRVAKFKKKRTKLSEKELAVHKKFIKKAFEQSENSKCWWRQVGAVLVNNGKILLRSFNEMMPSDDECYKIGCIRDKILPGKLPEICSVAHAESAVIAKAAKEKVGLDNTTLYVTHFPCSACSKLIALSGIKKIVYSQGSAVFDGERIMKSRGVDIIKL